VVINYRLREQGFCSFLIINATHFLNIEVAPTEASDNARVREGCIFPTITHINQIRSAIGT